MLCEAYETLSLTDVTTCQLIYFKISIKSANQNPKTNFEIFLGFLIQYFLILPVLCGHGTCSLTVREEHRLRVFQNMVLRKIPGPKRGWGNIGNGEDYMTRNFDLYLSPSIRVSNQKE